MFARFIGSVVLMAALTSTASAATCAQMLTAGETYEDSHSGPTLTWAGDIRIDATYACGSNTCFKGTMAFDGYTGENLVTGEMQGSSLIMRRFVDEGSFTQTWKGTCKASAVKGSWVNDINASDTGSFTIWY